MLGLLRQLEKAQSRPPKPPPKPKFPRGAAPGGPRHRDPSAAELEAAHKVAERTLGEDTMTIVRKLRTLQRKGKGMDPTLVVNKTRKYMATIGKRIDIVTANAGSGKADHSGAASTALWEYVSRFTENSMSGEKLEKLYHKVDGSHEHGDSGAGAGVKKEGDESGEPAPLGGSVFVDVVMPSMGLQREDGGLNVAPMMAPAPAAAGLMPTQRLEAPAMMAKPEDMDLGE